MKLHLGCGGKYLPGYVNIDNFLGQKVDKRANILDLKYSPSSVQEIRLHHVLEHFSRATAIALLACFWQWLMPKGILRIEVPDLEVAAKKIFTNNYRQKSVAVRHLFGSQEASWAFHYHGWTKQELTRLLFHLGFRNIKVSQFAHKGTDNLEVAAEKISERWDREKLLEFAGKYLQRYMVDKSISEKELLKTWLKEFGRQLDKGWMK